MDPTQGYRKIVARYVEERTRERLSGLAWAMCFDAAFALGWDTPEALREAFRVKRFDPWTYPVKEVRDAERR